MMLIKSAVGLTLVFGAPHVSNAASPDEIGALEYQVADAVLLPPGPPWMYFSPSSVVSTVRVACGVHSFEIRWSSEPKRRTLIDALLIDGSDASERLHFAFGEVFKETESVSIDEIKCSEDLGFMWMLRLTGAATGADGRAYRLLYHASFNEVGVLMQKTTREKIP